MRRNNSTKISKEYKFKNIKDIIDLLKLWNSMIKCPKSKPFE